MRYGYRAGVTLILLSVVSLLPVHAHHAVQAQFDVDTVKRLTGTLVKVEWLNPHSWLHFEVKDESGKSVIWQFETPGPSGMRKFGVTRAGFFKLGDVYNLEYIPARDGSPKGAPLSIEFPDGKKLVIRPSDPSALREAH